MVGACGRERSYTPACSIAHVKRFHADGTVGSPLMSPSKYRGLSNTRWLRKYNTKIMNPVYCTWVEYTGVFTTATQPTTCQHDAAPTQPQTCPGPFHASPPTSLARLVV